MTTYRKSMREALNEVYLGENNMNLLKKAAGGAMQTLKMKDGKVKMDSFTASAIMQVYKAINPKNKKTMENVVNTGTITALQKLQALAMRAIKSGDEVEHDGEKLDEAKYDLYHKDFSSAMQHSYKMAKKMYGITIDPKEIDDKVASGPRKPTEGKTNSYRLKGDKGAIQVQVYNKGGSKPFELNMYKEEVELDEAVKVGDTVTVKLNRKGREYIEKGKVIKIEKDSIIVKHDFSRTPSRVSMKNIVKEEIELDESKKALQNKADKSGVSYGILKKVYDRGMAAYKTGHRPGTTPQQWALARVNSFLTGGGARKADADLWKQAKGQKEEVELDEGKMSQLHQLMKDGKSAKEIAKIMKLDVKTIKALIGEELKEESARADAMRAMRRGKEVDPADVDDAASDDDVKAASKNIIMQLRKSVSLRGNFPVEFMDKKKVKVDAKIASAAQKKYNSMRKADDKEKFQAKIAKSYKDMLAALKEGFASDAQRRAAFAQGYKAKGKKGKKEDAILDRIGKKLKERKNG